MKVFHYSDRGVNNFDEFYLQSDVLVTTGDLTIFNFGSLSDMKDKKPAFGVYGNHCSGTYLEKLGIANLHNKVVEFKGLKWGGFQGCLRYKNTGIMYTEEEAKSFADNFPYVDVLLLHAGPLGLLDDPSEPVHIGSKNIRRYVDEKKPKVVFCGHQYTNAEMQYGETKLHRTFKARIIEV
jgi:Icc-related predicted phosphoesterase